MITKLCADVLCHICLFNPHAFFRITYVRRANAKKTRTVQTAMAVMSRALRSPYPHRHVIKYSHGRVLLAANALWPAFFNRPPIFLEPDIVWEHLRAIPRYRYIAVSNDCNSSMACDHDDVDFILYVLKKFTVPTRWTGDDILPIYRWAVHIINGHSVTGAQCTLEDDIEDDPINDRLNDPINGHLLAGIKALTSLEDQSWLLAVIDSLAVTGRYGVVDTALKNDDCRRVFYEKYRIKSPQEARIICHVRAQQWSTVMRFVSKKGDQLEHSTSRAILRAFPSLYRHDIYNVDKMIACARKIMSRTAVTLYGHDEDIIHDIMDLYYALIKKDWQQSAPNQYPNILDQYSTIEHGAALRYYEEPTRRLLFELKMAAKTATSARQILANARSYRWPTCDTRVRAIAIISTCLPRKLTRLTHNEADVRMPLPLLSAIAAPGVLKALIKLQTSPVIVTNANERYRMYTIMLTNGICDPRYFYYLYIHVRKDLIPVMIKPRDEEEYRAYYEYFSY